MHVAVNSFNAAGYVGLSVPIAWARAWVASMGVGMRQPDAIFHYLYVGSSGDAEPFRFTPHHAAAYTEPSAFGVVEMLRGYRQGEKRTQQIRNILVM